MDWNPTAYNRFAEQRNRPMLDLLDLLPPMSGVELVDLGCGDGRLTRVAAERLGASAVTAIDSAPTMLDKAKAGEDVAPTTWRLASIEDALSEGLSGDVVLANASLHFLDDHAALWPRLMASVRPGGWLAVHMPFNHVARSNILMELAARAEELSGQVDGTVRWPQERPDIYERWLRDAGFEHVLVQLRVYRHALEGIDAVVAWMRSGGLQPWLDRTPEALRATYVQIYTELMDQAYPALPGDLRLLDYTRLLIVARRPA